MGERRPPAGSDSRWRLRNWRVRARLVALILVPTAAAVLLGGIQVLNSTGAAAEYARTSDLARLSSQVGELTHHLADERARVSWFVARGRPAGGRDGIARQLAEVDTAAQAATDTAAQLAGELTGRTADEVETMKTRLEDLRELRKQALEGDLLPGATVDLYTTVIGDLLTVHDEVSKGADDDALFRQNRMLQALARAKESLSLQQALLTVVLVEGRFENDQLQRFLGELSREQIERKAFADEATAEERRRFDEAVNGRGADRALFLRELVLTRATSGAPLRGLDLTKSDDAREWFEASRVILDAMRNVERAQADAIVLRSEELSSTERRRAFVVAGAVVALLVAVLLITTGVARSLVRPLRRLRREALEIAGQKLPEFVQRLREARDGDAMDIPEVPPIGIFTRDEVGEVARAFDEVHREAVRLAGEEAKLRANVNAMFVNLSRRSQTLVERQLTLIERLERGERDDARLGDLFKLDHLATRMRRNSENLLVLAGQEIARKWTQPVELLDVVRAALGEVENYDRVSIQVASDVAVVGQAVNDVVHLLAELVENAISFSRHDTKVVISSSRIDGGGVMVSVSDQGIGMTQEELAQANWRLAHPPVVDVSVSRRMGLFVVGRLALRHDIRVQLRQQDVGGLSAMVLLPEHLLTVVPGQVPAPPPPPPASPDPFTYGHPSFDVAPTMDSFDRVDFDRAAFDRAAEPASSWFSRPSPSSAELPSLPSFPNPNPNTNSVGHGGAPVDPLGRVESRTDSWMEPRVEPSRMEPHIEPRIEPRAEEERLPVFDSMEQPSSWFTRAPVPAERPAERPAAPPRGDGWGAVAEPAVQPQQAGTTRAGLPKRTPRANLVPGAPPPPPQPMPPAPPVSPHEVRDRLSSYQQGIKRGRQEGSHYEGTESGSA
ncbi:nitrate- and nitrite sensing domain-containing protein [Thermoactinospora rubra]|uniref:nitrate- and nitrite sensing domain-containing protein n=1 Tax=Thermoactinospora rubra TaxID=1088767 RepID=UPI001F0B45E0|nr:nitrate- and nitrite sensing domain-containing protein [Thermoactinospora rubra]